MIFKIIFFSLRHSNVKATFTGFKKQTKLLKAIISDNANSSMEKSEQINIRQPTIFQNLVRTDHGTSSSTLFSAERDKIGGHQSTDTESQKSNSSKCMRPKHIINDDACTKFNFVDVFQKIGRSNMNEKQTLGSNSSSNKKDDWYEIIYYKTPSNFTIQNKSIDHEKQMFQKYLNELAPSWDNETNPKKNHVYAVNYDGKWVRAKLGDPLYINSNGKWFRMVDDDGYFKVPTNR